MHCIHFMQFMQFIQFIHFVHPFIHHPLLQGRELKHDIATLVYHQSKPNDHPQVAEARSICRGMLQRDPLQRLGYRGAQEIKTHPFFASIDFDALLNKQLEPPFKPVVHGTEDTRNVDKTFTSIPAAVTPTPADGALSKVNEDFKDFTYTATLGDGAESYRVTALAEEEVLEEEMLRSR